jgi:hypothetical protein
MRQVAVLLLLPLIAACEQEPQLTLAEKVKKITAECQELAVQKSGFDPRTAEEPPRTLSTTTKRGGEVLGSGAVARGAARGAAAGAVGGAIADDAGTGAAAGAAIGGLLGGIRRHREADEPVTRTYANPAYEEYVAAQQSFKQTFGDCMREKGATTE